MNLPAMDRGTIPGYYYDSEKRKYFKIQANHVVSSRMKHTVSNVKHEQRESKKRKVQDLKDVRIRQQTVRPSRISAASDIALNREIGSCHTLNARDAFFVAGLQSSIVNVSAPPRYTQPQLPLTGAHLTGEYGQLLMTVGFDQGRYLVVTAKPQPEGRRAFGGWERFDGPVHVSQSISTYAFTSSVISIATGKTSLSDRVPLVICAQQAASHGDVMCTVLCEGDDDNHIPQVLLSLTTGEGWLWASSMQPGTNETAIAGTDGIYVVDAAGTLKAQERISQESRAVMWLDQNTVVYAQPGGDRPEPPTAKIHLWDLRSGGKSLRFTRPRQKYSRIITGLKNPDESSTHILASDNGGFSLYDTRINTKPLLSFTHVHEGPQLRFDVFQQQTVAAVDRENEIQFYSLRNGKHIGTKQSPLPGRSPFSSLSFHGSVMLACQGGHLVRWTYGGISKEDEAL